MNGQVAGQDPQTTWQFTPGETISPEAASAPAATAVAEPPVATPPQASAAQPSPAPAVRPPQPVMQSNDGSISWTASEYVAHHKSPGWYVGVVLAAAVLAVVVYFTTKDKISAAVLAVAGIALAAYGARLPRQLQYSLNGMSLTIGQKSYGLDLFRSFSIIDDGAFSSIVFMPMKRFAPQVTVYYDPKDEEKIVTLLAERLPMEDRQRDAVEKFMRRIRF